MPDGTYQLGLTISSGHRSIIYFAQEHIVFDMAMLDNMPFITKLVNEPQISRDLMATIESIDLANYHLYRDSDDDTDESDDDFSQNGILNLIQSLVKNNSRLRKHVKDGRTLINARYVWNPYTRVI